MEHNLRQLKRFAAKPPRYCRLGMEDQVRLEGGYAYAMNGYRFARVPCPFDVPAIVPLVTLVDIMDKLDAFDVGSDGDNGLEFVYSFPGLTGMLRLKGYPEWPNVARFDNFRPKIGELTLTRAIPKSQMNMEAAYSPDLHAPPPSNFLEFSGQGSITFRPRDIADLYVNRPVDIHQNGDGILELRMQHTALRLYVLGAQPGSAGERRG